MTAAAGSRPGVLERAFALLAAFDDRRTSLTLTALARSSGLPANTALRLARELVRLGALEQDEEGRYVIGLRLFEIAALAPRGHGLRRTAMPFLEDLSGVTGEHVLLSVREGAEAVLVERLSRRDAGPVAYRIGGRMPLDATGAGLVLLAHAPADLQESVLGEYRPQTGDDGIASAADLRHRLADIRRDGFVVAGRAGPEPRSTAAAPIRDHHSTVVAALSVVVDAGGTDIRTLVPAVATIARAISRELGPMPAAGLSPD
ncbi:IclR family transcriptional regulator [Micromonosporaceae bacterium Da 78-11]